jgi:hypothetical protein
MPQFHDLPLTASVRANSDSQSVKETGRNGAFEWSLFGLFVLLLALVTLRHEMCNDELQAWLIARDSHSLGALFRNLRYEGHPALWYLVLYIPAHISWNPVSMQVINYLFAVAEAWLILSAHKLRWFIRTLAIFSFFIFFDYGVVSRNYMLAALLLTAAARCLLGERQHRKLAIVLLALAMNAHVFAIPVAGVLAIWMFGLAKLDSWKDLRKLLPDREFWTALVILLASVAAVYITVRPPADLSVPQYGVEHHSIVYNLLLSEGKTWQTFLPVPESSVPEPLREFLFPRLHLVPLASGFSLALFLLVAATLRTNWARSFFLAASALDMLAFALTVHVAAIRYLGFIFTAFLIALLIDAYSVPAKPSRSWLPRPMATGVLLAIFGLHALAGLYTSVSDWILPFSEGRAASSWLEQRGLEKNPLVIEPDLGVSILAYTERPQAYYPACHCFGSYTVWNSERVQDRLVNEDELENLEHSSPLSVIVVSLSPLPTETVTNLRLREIGAFDNRSMTRENYFIYQRVRE